MESVKMTYVRTRFKKLSYKTIAAFCCLFFFPAAVFSQSLPSEKEINRKVDSVLRLMTLQEKVGQLTQYTGDRNTATGPLGKPIDKLEEIKAGRVGSLLNVRGAAAT